MIIGLAGRAGVGKTTIANMLVERDGYVIRNFAYPLKKSLAVLTGLPMEHFLDIALKEVPTDIPGDWTPRQLMQVMGTEFVRDIVHPDFWIWRMEQVLTSMDSSIKVVIDDCRFENEVSLIRKAGGHIIHLRRDFDSSEEVMAHRSEKGLRVRKEDSVIDSGGAGPMYTYDELCSLGG